MEHTVRQIYEGREKKYIARIVLEALPDWFGIPEACEEYISASESQPFFAAESDGVTTGFLCLKETGNATVELAVMGVLKEYHRHGIGRLLFNAAKEYAVNVGYSFMQVKTVRMGMYDDYDATNRFYLSLGFMEFEVFPTLWDESNPCQIYIMNMK